MKTRTLQATYVIICCNNADTDNTRSLRCEIVTLKVRNTRLRIEPIPLVEDIDCAASDITVGKVNGAGVFTVPCTLRSTSVSGTGRVPIEELRKLNETDSASHGGYRIVRFENASVIVERGDRVESIAKPIMREIAADI